MADGQLTAFPIKYNNADNPNAKADKTTTINGLDLSQNRVLKSAQFSEAMTGEKMLANLNYDIQAQWDSNTKRSIKSLDGNTFLDSSALAGLVRAAFPSNGNANDYIVHALNGIYYVGNKANMQNIPESWGYLISMSTGTVGFQLYCGISSSDIYSRRYSQNGGGWSNWIKYDTGTTYHTSYDTRSISLGSNGYVLAVTRERLGIPSTATITGLVIEGWDGGTMPISLALSSDKQSVYVMGKSNDTLSYVVIGITYRI